LRQLAICNVFKYLPRVYNNSFRRLATVYILKKLNASPISNAHWHSQCVTCAVNWRYFAIFLRRVERPQVINLIFSTHFLPPLSCPPPAAVSIRTRVTSISVIIPTANYSVDDDTKITI